MKKGSRFAVVGKRLLSSTLITALLLSGFVATDIYYNYSPTTAKAATLTGKDSSVSAPSFNAANLPTRDTTGTVSYWFAGNEFHALNQMTDGIKQTGSGTSGHLKVYSDSYGSRLVDTTSGSQTAVKGNFTNGSQFDTFTTRSDIDFDTVWELMDTDAVWDDQYLFAQYYTHASECVTSDFAPTILQTVENWYKNGFSYDGSKNSRPTITASGTSWFSTAEQSAVKSASVKTDGVSGVSTTSSSTDTLSNAHLFAASIDEMYYNPVQVEEVISNLRKDYSDTYNGTSWQWARSHLWSRSFWGVHSDSNRRGFIVPSSGQVLDNGVADELAVAPAFYLNLEEVVMARSASNAATSVAAGTGISAYSANDLDTSEGIKFLVQDDSFASNFKTSVASKSADAARGTTYTVSYSGATTSTVNDAGTDSALVISAILYDEDGKIVYYGPLSKVSSESGTVNLTIPEEVSNGAYTLAVFEEQLGGKSTYDTSKNSKNGSTFTGTHTYTAYETDYQSGSVSYTALNVIDIEEENETGFDSETWYTYKDSSTGVEWKYKLDGNGDIIGLYTKSSIVKLVDGGGTLNIPAKVAGRTVVKIGGGTEDTPVVPASERSWTTLSLPSTVTTINDYAFYGSTAMANITIPTTVTAIGVKAFYDSEITGVKVSEMNGTIGSYAFAETSRLSTITLKGGETGLTVSTVAFTNTAATDLTIRGNVDIHKKAFSNNASLANVNISGDVVVGESAFSDCTAVTSLQFGGTTEIGESAFSDLTSLESLYLPVGTTISAYSFDGATALNKLESDISLPAHSFENCGSIETLVLDKNVAHISYDWEGHSSSISKRTVYVKNENMTIDYYGKDGTYYSALGSSGDVIVYVPATSSVDLGTTVKTTDEGVLTLNGYTSYAHSGDYSNYIKGLNNSVTIYAKQNIDTQMSDDNVTNLKDSSSEKSQTGIDAFYNGMILTSKDIDKTNMSVVRMFGSEEGDAYSVGEFYVVRTTEFNTEAKKEGGVTEEAIASYEPVHATDSDLDEGATTGTISVTVVVFYDVTDGDGNVTAHKYYSTPVSIRAEEYTAKSYIEQVYGSYDAIADKLVELDNQIADLQKQLEEADVDSVEELTKELNEYKVAYAELVKTLEEYVSDNVSADGYFGTNTDATTGKTTEVVYIKGNGYEYTDTTKMDADGNKIYKVSYDSDGDGEAEDTYIVVKDDGVHVVNEDGSAVLEDGKDLVYKDSLGALERQAAAQLADIKAQLLACDEGIAKVKKALSDAGYSFNDTDDEYTQIVDAIEDMAGKVDDLTSDLETANKQIDNYATALDTIYNKLTGSTLKADEISGLANTLNAIVGKIQSLQNDLSVAQATVTDLQAQLSSAESQVSKLESELTSTRSELETANTALATAKSDLATAKSDKETLQAEYEAAIAAGDKEAAEKLQAQIDEKNAAIEELEATTTELETTKANLEQKEVDLKNAQDTVTQLQSQIEAKNKEISELQSKLDALTDTASGFKMTVDTANKLFGLSLADGTTDEEVYSAIQEYVNAKLSSDETISAIQKLVNSTNTGTALVSDVEAAISSGSGSGADTDDENSASYKNGYEAGYAAGKAESGSSTDNGSYSEGYAAGVKSVNTTTYYTNGYNAGYKDGVSSASSSSSGDTTALSKQISSLTSQVSTLTSTNNTLSEKISTLTSDNANLTSQVSSLQTQVSKLKSSGSATATTASNNTTANASTNTNSKNNTSANAKSKNSTAEDVEAETTVEKPVAESEEEFNDNEGSTAITAESVNVVKKMGEYVTTKLPTTTETATDQKAMISWTKLSDASKIIVTTNAAQAQDASEEQLANAEKVINYYMNHLDELGKLGADDIRAAANDSAKSVTCETISSIDVTPSETQQEAMDNGEMVDLKITSDAIENGSIYLIVHESDMREGTFDVLLCEADGDALNISIPDLSPITISKLTVEDIEELNVTEDSTEDSPEALAEDESDNSGFRIAVYILLVVAIGGACALLVLAKKRNGGSSLPFMKRK